ncbi:MAG: hypothetical protein IKU86_10090, partial [Thermoguttaceae bacterium]|nr:hypothetical protein [Thermoguttaceae bacterium]
APAFDSTAPALQPARKRGRPRKNPLPTPALDQTPTLETPSFLFERSSAPGADAEFAFDASVFQASSPRSTAASAPLSPISPVVPDAANSRDFLASPVYPISPVPTAPKRGRGRPRKNPLPTEPQTPTFETPVVSPPSPPDLWSLSESERAVWSTATADERFDVAPTNAPQKRGRKPKTAVASVDSFDDEVLRDANGFNIVKKPKAQPRAAAGSSAVRLASLDTFVEGFSNQLARKIADVAILQPGAMNPIFIGGPTSVGKTHLLEGICERYGRYPNRKPALYMTAEQFTTAFIQSLRGGAPFRDRFRNLSLLAIDDLHFLEGKTTTQIELLSVVDMLRQRNVQLVFSANRPLGELTKLSGELTTRVQGGFVCQIGPPERETLSQILRQMALERRLELPDEVCRFVVSRFATHARQLSGALNRLYVARLTTGAPIDVPFAQEALADLIASNVRAVKLEDVERVVQETFGLGDEELKSKSRSKRCADPRALAMWLARKHTRSALAEIGAYFGGRRHTAVLSAQKKVDRLLQANATLENGSAALAVSDAIERMERSLALSRS